MAETSDRSTLERVQRRQTFNFGRATLYLEQLEEIERLARAAAAEDVPVVVWEAGGHKANSLGDLSEIGPGPWHEAELRAGEDADPIEVRFGESDIEMPHIHPANRDQVGTAALVGEVIRRRQSWRDRIGAWGLLIDGALWSATSAVLLLALLVVLRPDADRTVTVAIVGAAVVLVVVLLWLSRTGGLRGRTKLYLMRQRDHQSVWTANRDRLIVDGTIAIAIAVVAFILGKLWP